MNNYLLNPATEQFLCDIVRFSKCLSLWDLKLLSKPFIMIFRIFWDKYKKNYIFMSFYKNQVANFHYNIHYNQRIEIRKNTEFQKTREWVPLGTVLSQSSFSFPLYFRKIQMAGLFILKMYAHVCTHKRVRKWIFY